MHPAAVIEQLDVIEDRRPCRIAALKVAMVNHFVLQVSEGKFLGTEPDYSQMRTSRITARFFSGCECLSLAIQLPTLLHKLFSLLFHSLAERFLLVHALLRGANS
jgi:hypothetical protein